MVEGPGCTNNGRRLASLTGQTVAGLSGPSAKGANEARGKILVEVLTLGKELFIFFGNELPSPLAALKGPFAAATEAAAKREPRPPSAPLVHAAVRLHFGMSGSIHLTGDAEPRSSNKQLSLCIHFAGGTRLKVFDSTVSSAETTVARLKIAANRSRDVCAPETIWDEAAATTALIGAAVDSPDIATAVLDQDVLPGAGNIIKNEALHKAGVSPSAAVDLLTADQLLQIVRECRKYSVAWQRAGRAPAKLIYDKTVCGSCGGPVEMSRLGPGGGRPTFSCAACVSAGGPRIVPGKKRKAAGEDTTEPRLPPPPPPPGTCPLHPRASKLSRVRKTGGNCGRLFFGCRARDCSHFSWADGYLGKCSCGKTAGLRICKKEGANSSRWFVTCRERACGHFEWATEEVTRKFGNLLTPLT
jgi:formamidopyrimidine-DNA glycosylase